MEHGCTLPARCSHAGSKKGDDNEQFLRAYTWDGRSLTPTFELDFSALGLGRPHHMLFGSTKIGKKAPTGSLTKAQ